MHKCQYFVLQMPNGMHDLCPNTGLCGEKPATDSPRYGWPTALKLCDVVNDSVFTSVVCFNNTRK